MFTASGVGTLLGNYFAGQVLESNQVDGSTGWVWFWLVPAAAAAVVLVMFLALFREDPLAADESSKFQVSSSKLQASLET
jgi:hypothetical protein